MSDFKKMNDFKHLKKWCAEYYEKTSLRIHPANVPQEVILNELLGRILAIEARLPESMKAPEKPIEIETVNFRGTEIPVSELMALVTKSKR